MSWRHFGDNARKQPVIRARDRQCATKKILRITPATYSLLLPPCTRHVYKYVRIYPCACSYMSTLLSLLAVEIVNLFLQFCSTPAHPPTNPPIPLPGYSLACSSYSKELMRMLTIIMLMMMLMVIIRRRMVIHSKV